MSDSKSIRLIRPSVVVLCGPAACGKSTFAARHFRPTQVIGSDHARALVCDDERDQRFQEEAFALVHFLIAQRLRLNRLCVVDSTALTFSARRSLLELARKHEVPCEVVLFDIPLETCVARDQGRERSVGRAVIERQYQFFEQAKSSIRQEGFGRILQLKDEELGTVNIEILFRPVARPAASPPRSVAGLPRRSTRLTPGTAKGAQAAPQGRPPVAERAPAPSSFASRAVDQRSVREGQQTGIPSAPTPSSPSGGPPSPDGGSKSESQS